MKAVVNFNKETFFVQVDSFCSMLDQYDVNENSSNNELLSAFECFLYDNDYISEVASVNLDDDEKNYFFNEVQIKFEEVEEELKDRVQELLEDYGLRKVVKALDMVTDEKFNFTTLLEGKW